MSYPTPTLLAAEHEYRTERLARSWGGTLPHLSRVRALTVRPRRPAAAPNRVAGPVTDYRERVLVGLR